MSHSLNILCDKQRLKRSCWITYHFTHFISEILYFNEIEGGGSSIRDIVKKFNSGLYLYNKVLNSKLITFLQTQLNTLLLILLRCD